MDHPNLNEIVILPVNGTGTALAVESPLFNIESTNTTEARIQAVSTENGNEHTVQKLSNESLLATKIPEGQVALVPSTANNEGRSTLADSEYWLILLKP